MKEKTEDIMKMNELYLEECLHKNQSYCQPIEKEKDNQDSNEEKNEQFKNYNYDELPQIPKTEKIYIHNFDYVNDNFRKQLNKAFLLFNPLIHLENLYRLQKADPSIKEDINKLRETVNEDLKEVTDKKYYKKKYEELIKKNRAKNRKNDTSSEELTSPKNSKDNNNTKNQKSNKATLSYMARMRQTNPFDNKKRFPRREMRAKECIIIYFIYKI